MTVPARSPAVDRRTLLAGTVALALAGCTPFRGAEPLRIMVPTPPGGGFDHTARTLAAALEESGTAPDVTVFNLPGNHGTAALSRLIHERGTSGLLLQMGLGMVANTHVETARERVTDATPIARLIEEPEVLLVPADSQFQTLSQLLEAWQRDPAGLTVAGGSTPGGPDHLVTVLLAGEVGIDPGTVQYRSYDGGGPMQAALLRHEVAFGAAGHSEQRAAIDSGQLRVLATSGAEPDPRLPAPTLAESGLDLVFTNWRGLLGPPDLDADVRSGLMELVERLHGSAAWARRLERNRWVDAYLPGEEFAGFLAEEDRRTGEALARLGIT